MGIIKLEKERDRKERKHIKDLVELVKEKKQIVKYKEDQLRQKLGIHKKLKKFLKPVTEELEKYHKSNKEVVKEIQEAIENISLPLLEPSRIPQIAYMQLK